jgi:hypothetical protein
MGLAGPPGKSVAVRVIANMLIGGGAGGGEFNVPVGEARSFQIEAPANVVTAWYMPVDNLPDLVKFHTISVRATGNNRVGLTVKAAQDALLRIHVLAEMD